MTLLAVVLPFASTLLGAAITYVVNVRQRHRTYVEDLANSAIAAVSAAEVSVDYLASAGRPVHMTDEDFIAFQSWLVTEGMKAWATKVAQANETLARVLPYQPALARLLPYSPDTTHRETDKPIIAELRAVRPDSRTATGSRRGG